MTQNIEPSIAANEPRKQTHPWRRCWAKTVDIVLFAYFLCAILIAVLVAGASLPEDLGGSWLAYFVFIVFFILVESFSLAMFSTTPGKALFGMRVEATSGAKPSYLQSVKRNILCQVLGNALSIPGLMFIANIVAYQRLVAVGRSSWDRIADTRVAHEDSLSLVRQIFCALTVVGLLGLFIGLQIFASGDSKSR